MLPLSVVAGPQKMLTVTLKSAKIVFKKHFSSLRQGGTYSLIYLKAKNEEKFKNIYFDLVQIKKQFCPFWENKN